MGRMVTVSSRRHHLKDIARADVVACFLDDVEISLFGGIGLGFLFHGFVAEFADINWGFAIKMGNNAREALCGLCKGGLGGVTSASPNRGHKGQFALHRVKHHHHRGADHHGVGHIQRVRVDVWEMLDLADHVVAQIAKQTCGHWGQLIWQVNFAFGKDRTQTG